MRVSFTDDDGYDETLTSKATAELKAAVAQRDVRAPVRVTGVEVVAGGDGYVLVSWDETSGAAGYKVQWKSGSETFADSRQQVVSGGATTSATVSALTVGTEYQVRVIATDTSGDGPASLEVAGTPVASVVLVHNDMNADAQATVQKSASQGFGVNPDNDEGTEFYTVTQVQLFIISASNLTVAVTIEDASLLHGEVVQRFTAPGTLAGGSYNTFVAADLVKLNPGTTYYVTAKASQAGAIHFKAARVPRVTTRSGCMAPLMSLKLKIRRRSVN